MFNLYLTDLYLYSLVSHQNTNKYIFFSTVLLEKLFEFAFTS